MKIFLTLNIIVTGVCMGIILENMQIGDLIWDMLMIKMVPQIKMPQEMMRVTHSHLLQKSLMCVI